MTPGDILNIPDDEARIWLNHGMAMQDKSIDVPEHPAASIEAAEQISVDAVDGDVLPPQPSVPDVVRSKKRKVRRAKK